jgi:hypothetical protein
VVELAGVTPLAREGRGYAPTQATVFVRSKARAVTYSAVRSTRPELTRRKRITDNGLDALGSACAVTVETQDVLASFL